VGSRHLLRREEAPDPEDEKQQTLWCRDCKDSHEFTVYATWIWWKRSHKRRSFDRFMKESIRHYSPWLESNFLSYRPSILTLFGGGEKHEYPAPKPDCLKKMAALYGFEGKQ
jgi:hypothetical protein